YPLRRPYCRETQRRPHDLLCGSIYSLPKGPCPKGRTDSGRSYRVKSENQFIERKGPLRNQRPFFISRPLEAPQGCRGIVGLDVVKLGAQDIGFTSRPDRAEILSLPL